VQEIHPSSVFFGGSGLWWRSCSCRPELLSMAPLLTLCECVRCLERVWRIWQAREGSLECNCSHIGNNRLGLDQRTQRARVWEQMATMAKLDWWTACNKTDEGWPALEMLDFNRKQSRSREWGGKTKREANKCFETNEQTQATIWKML